MSMLRQRVRQRQMHMPLQQMRLLLDENSVTTLNTYLNFNTSNQLAERKYYLNFPVELVLSFGYEHRYSASRHPHAILHIIYIIIICFLTSSSSYSHLLFYTSLYIQRHRDRLRKFHFAVDVRNAPPFSNTHKKLTWKKVLCFHYDGVTLWKAKRLDWRLRDCRLI